MKKGFTLLEVVVALGVFTTVVTLAVGAFSLIINLRILSGNIKEMNHKIRYSLEIISRLARQAERVELTGNQMVTMYFFINDPTQAHAQRFIIDTSNPEDGKLYTQECQDDSSALSISKSCSSLGWSPAIDLLQGAVALDSSSKFNKTGTIVPTLDIDLSGRIYNSSLTATRPYLNNNFKLESVIVMESLK